ncbi:MAG: nucleotidyl transferase AbiEii/AbiGii toxin family protein [Bryobacteraceae bacterium]
MNTCRNPGTRSFATSTGRSTKPIALQCRGGFAMAMLYGLPRPTVDVDFLSLVPAGEIGRLDALAGRGSALDRKHGAHVQHVGIVTVPENYAERLIPIFPGAYRRVRLAGLEGHDLALSKLERNSGRDRQDVKFLARAVPLNLATLEERYRLELRPYLAATDRHDLTMRLWIEMLQITRSPSLRPPG